MINIKAHVVRRREPNGRIVHCTKNPTPIPHVVIKKEPVVVIKKDPTHILLTGGIGDVITLESYFSLEDRNSIKEIYLATRACKHIDELFNSLPNTEYPNLKIIELPCVFSKKLTCLIHTNAVKEHLRTNKKDIKLPDNIIDYSISRMFPKIQSGEYKYTYSSFIKHKLADISKFNLPEKYFVIFPITNEHHKIDSQRNFNASDWEQTSKILQEKNMNGVIIHKGNEKIPKYDNLIDLSNNTTITESIEILKHAFGYIGIDSFLSVLATKIFIIDNIWIKSNEKNKLGHNLNRWKHIYYHPKLDFKFIDTKIIGGRKW